MENMSGQFIAILAGIVVVLGTLGRVVEMLVKHLLEKRNGGSKSVGDTMDIRKGYFSEMREDLGDVKDGQKEMHSNLKLETERLKDQAIRHQQELADTRLCMGELKKSIDKLTDVTRALSTNLDKQNELLVGLMRNQDRLIDRLTTGPHTPPGNWTVNQGGKAG